MTKKAVRVLVVEDSEDDARLAMLALKRGGFEPEYQRVQDADTLRAAMARQPWDVVLSDFRLPHFSGVQALAVFREADIDIPFIFVSGTIGEMTAVEAMKAGASDYVMKGNLTRLVPALERELEQAVIRSRHREAQRDLELSRDRYRDLFDSAPVGYFTLTEDGTIGELNAAGAELLGRPREELLGGRFTQHVASEDVERWFEQFVVALHDGRRQRMELAVVKADGLRFHAQLHCMRMAQGAASTVVRMVMTDISDRKQAEADMRQYEAQLRHVQKMESVGTLAGGIAHDFNNILGAVLGHVALAREELGAEHTVTRHLDEIHRAGLRARDLVRQILTFSRREPQELKTYALAPVVEETLTLLRATLPAGVHLDAHIATSPVNVHADATQIQQVLLNLCTNAWHALTGGTGHIVVGVQAATLHGQDAARLGFGHGGAYAHLWVRDDGCGMDEATRERMFEPFFTTKPVGQGTGLGLSVVHGIVVAHKGTIDVESTPGKGSCFHLYFPLANQQGTDAEAERASETTTASAARGERVMVIDDDEVVLLMIEQLLVRRGYRVTAFLDARAALAALRLAPEGFDCVITDFNMPECSGVDVARTVVSLCPRMPVIISSGYITDELTTAAREIGVRGLVEKQDAYEAICPLLARVLSSPA